MPCKNGIYCQRKVDCQDLTCPGRPSTCQQVAKESNIKVTTLDTMVDTSESPHVLHYSNDNWYTGHYCIKLTLLDRFKLFLGVTTLAKIIQNKHKP